MTRIRNHLNLGALILNTTATTLYKGVAEEGGGGGGGGEFDEPLFLTVAMDYVRLKSLGSQTLDEEYYLLVLLASKVITLLKLFVMLSCMSFKVIIN